MFCTSSERIYYLKFYSIITDLRILRFTYNFINPQIIILKSIRPKLASQQILAVYKENNYEI